MHLSFSFAVITWHWPPFVSVYFERVFVSMTTIANGSSAKLKKLPSGKEVSSATPSSQAPSAEIAKLSGGKPDLNHHHLQLDLIKAEIDKTTTELVSVGLYSRRSIDVGQSANQELPLGQCQGTALWIRSCQYARR